MGNNHDKYFGKDQRKVLILGFPGSGKTTILESITQGKAADTKNQRTKDLTIKDAKLGPLFVTFFDLSGGERQRIFWKQHYEGAQGIIFVISATAPEDQLASSLRQIEKMTKLESLKGIPFSICLHKSDLINQSERKISEKKIMDFSGSLKIKMKVFDTDANNKEKVKIMINWLLMETKPL